MESAINFTTRSVKAFVIGLKQLPVAEKGKDDKCVRKNLIGLAIAAGVSALVFVLVPSMAEVLLGLIEEHPKWYLQWINAAVLTKFLSVVVLSIPVIYVINLGMSQVRSEEMLQLQFDQMGLVSRGKDRKTPKLLKVIPGNGRKIYLFGSAGIPLKAWHSKMPEICQAFNDEIHEIAYHSGNMNVVKLVILDEEERQREDERREERRFYDNIFENARLYPKTTREVVRDGSIVAMKDYPELVDKIVEGRTTTYQFKSVGTSLDMWRDAKGVLQNHLNTTILRIENAGADKQLFNLVSTDHKLENLYPWKDNYIQDEDGLLTVGEGYLGQVVIDVKTTNNILIGGTQGSGKSVIMNCIAYQFIRKGAAIYGIDFKGGIELGMFADFGPIVSDYDDVLPILDPMVREIKARMKEFQQYKGVKKITDYNAVVPEDKRFARIVLLVDEIAELLDSTGASGGKKDQLDKIEGRLNTIARLGRAAGVHIVTGTQRPDAKVLKGQIKNNLDCRISGRMTDKEPSLMVLGSPAATEIPENIKGRYMITRGADPVEFQGYFFEEEQIKPGNYLKGRTLVLGTKAAQGQSGYNEQADPEDLLEDYDYDDDEDFEPVEMLDDDFDEE